MDNFTNNFKNAFSFNNFNELLQLEEFQTTMIVLCIFLTNCITIVLFKLIQATIERIDRVHKELDDNSEIVNKNFDVLETFLDKRLETIEDIFKMVNEEFINADKKMEDEIYRVDEKLCIHEKKTLQFVEKTVDEFVNIEKRFEEINEKTNQNKRQIEELVNKIQEHYDWYFSIKTWRHKPSPYVDSVEIDIDTENKKHLLIQDGIKIILSEPLVKIMNKYFDYTGNKLDNIFTKYSQTYTVKDNTFCGVHFQQGRFFGDFDSYGNFHMCKNLYANDNQPKSCFFQSIKNLGETDEEFEIRFLKTVLTVCEDAYNHYKLYLFSCSLDCCANRNNQESEESDEYFREAKKRFAKRRMHVIQSGQEKWNGSK